MSAPIDHPLYLCSPVNALVEGIYEEKIPLQEVLQHGDFGLGTFDHVDGEMVILDGHIFQIDGGGVVREMPNTAHTPFACVTFYQPTCTEEFDGTWTWESFERALYSLLPSRNIFYALRIEGEFEQVNVRSIPRQDSYRPLVEVAREQALMEFHGVHGTVAGFYTPAFMANVNVPGLHLHFLSDDRTRGGHLMSCVPRKVRVGIQYIRRMELALPITLDYLTQDFTRDAAKDLDEAE